MLLIAARNSSMENPTPPQIMIGTSDRRRFAELRN